MKTKIMATAFCTYLALLPVQADISTSSSGNWDAAGTWVGGTEPTLNDRVLVKYNHTVTVDSAGNQAGSLRLDAGLAFINLNAGGSLEVVNNGTFPTNGTVTFKAAGTGNGFNVQGGTLTVGGSFELGGGNAGITNFVNVTSGAVDLTSYSTIGTVGAGSALLNIEGSAASLSVGGNLLLGSGAVLRWAVAENGTVTAINSDNFKNVTLDGALIVDLSSMTATPDEIILIDNNGVDALIGNFSSATLIGGEGYSLSYTGGDGNDLSLVIPEPATLGLVVLVGGGLLGARRFFRI